MSTMEDPNPYSAPHAADATATAAAPAPAHVEALRAIAAAQRELTMVILGYLGLIALQVVQAIVPDLPLGLLTLPIGLTVLIAGMIFTVKLARRLHGPGAALLCAVGLLIPIVGLFVLVALSGEATKRLRAAGYRVGLLGAAPDQFR